MRPLLFVDSNIFMYAAGGPHPYKEPCSQALRKAARENYPLAADAEVLQEILYRYWSQRKLQLGRETYQDVKAVVSLILPVTERDTDRALGILEADPQLKLRDAIHAAVMLNHEIVEILTVDRHFEHVEGLKRIDPLDFP